jgi:uncharacterized protein YecE (DUF72 family)
VVAVFEGDPGLRIGTSSWSEKDWVGVFYPPGTAPAAYIEHYATVYDTVEVDATFYRSPTERMVDAWARRTPENFRFAAKVPRAITHEKVLVDAEGEMTLFVETMRRLGDRLGPLLLQFPYFNRQAFPGPEPFLERLDRVLGTVPPGVRLAVELRNPRWVGRAAQEVCARHGAALAWVEQAWMPKAAEWPKLTGGPSADFAYVRFLGDHKAIEEITDRWDCVVIDRTEVLERWAPIVRELRARRVDVFGFFNNHFAGHAPATIELFREIWKKSSES